MKFLINFIQNLFSAKKKENIIKLPCIKVYDFPSFSALETHYNNGYRAVQIGDKFYELSTVYSNVPVGVGRELERKEISCIIE